MRSSLVQEISNSQTLRRKINKTLRSQGYAISNGTFLLTRDDRGHLRHTHALARTERLREQTAFIHGLQSDVQKHMINGRELSVEDIAPKLIQVKARSHWESLFRWWNYVWWSVPYESAYGRQMRYLVWDQYHQAVIGLIGLHSPILSWAPRDRYLGIRAPDRAYWVNQSMSAQRLGAVPPYNIVLGGKLVAMLMASDTTRRDFRKKYSKACMPRQEKASPANLLFVTTTGAFGKSSLYTRLKLGEEWLARFIGYSNGSGSFHIPNKLYEEMLVMLSEKGADVARGYGHGPSRKMRLISQGMAELGYQNGVCHGIKRAIYLFPFAKNLDRLIKNQCRRPVWHQRPESDLTDFWKDRWILPRLSRSGREEALRTFSKEQFVNEQLKHVQQIGR